jgi:hypothetical protein
MELRFPQQGSSASPGGAGERPAPGGPRRQPARSAADPSPPECGVILVDTSIWVEHLRSDIRRTLGR